MRELEVGTYVARMLAPALPNAFVQARYAYSFAERIAGIHHDRSNLDLEVGYILTPAVRVFVIGAGQKTHGGIDTPDAGWRAMPVSLAEHHDRIARLEMLDFGGGIQVSVARSIDLFGSFMTTTAGRNSHALARGITVGASWSFGARRASPRRLRRHRWRTEDGSPQVSLSEIAPRSVGAGEKPISSP